MSAPTGDGAGTADTGAAGDGAADTGAAINPASGGAPPKKTAAEALRAATLRLRAGGIEGAPTDARILLAHAMDLARDRLTLHLDAPLAPQAATRLETMLQARLARQPVAQIIGHRGFYGRDFRVTPDVLDPRPETETLIEAALAQPFASLLDLGTGSGCILLTLLAERPAARGLGTDISSAALQVARDNAARLGIAHARFQQSNWFETVPGQFDLITANPPYIAADEMTALAPELGWEPRGALTDGGDGLGAYRAICAGAARHLPPAGRLIVEIGPTQSAPVSALFQAAGLADIRVLRDLDGRPRIVTGTATSGQTG